MLEDFDDEGEDCNIIYGPKIIYASRTHSQLSQFVSEIKKTLYSDAKCVTLGSRKNLCCNDHVLQLRSISKINDKCLDLQVGPETTKCPYFSKDQKPLNDFADITHAVMQDIEELSLLGRKLKVCSYYGARNAVNDADIICVPYNLLLQQSAREATGIKLENSIVIIDEAHNLIDSITSIHSILLEEPQIQKCNEQLKLYYEKYQSKFKGKTIMYVKQLMYFINKILNYFKSLESSFMMSVNSFLSEINIDHFNLFKLLSFIKESRIANKLLGFSEQIRKKEMIKEGKEYSPIHESPMRNIENFLSVLNNPENDGRVLVTKNSGAAPNSVKYILLNPAEVFEPILKQARSVILAGGTMAPISDFLEQVLLF